MKKNHETKLTSVNVLTDIYKDFKVTTVEGNINLQKLVNRSLDLYNQNNDFKKIIDDHNKIVENNSKF
jgi:hypothetical protein